jgi:hypothetical protein
MTNGNSGTKSCFNLDAPEWYAKTLVRSGIYEGETIIFPLIAGKAENAIHKLLEMENSERYDHRAARQADRISYLYTARRAVVLRLPSCSCPR